VRAGRDAVLVLAVALLGGCASIAMQSISFVTPELSEAYIPLYMGTVIGTARYAAAIVVAPNVAVTNNHNANLLTEESILARSPAHDLLFFRTERTRVPLLANPQIGQTVIAYGQDGRNRRREAKGVIRQLDARALPICAGCPERPTVTYDAEAGEGFSGGPVVDVASGAIVAITVGYPLLQRFGMKAVLFLVPARVAGDYLAQEMGLSFGSMVSGSGDSSATHLAVLFELTKKNVVVELVAGGQKKALANYAHELSVQVAEQYGHLYVRKQGAHTALPEAYVKVYARTKDGLVKFYKDGYADVRGCFDYTSLSTDELDDVERFSILVITEAHGAVIREARPPQR